MRTYKTLLSAATALLVSACANTHTQTTSPGELKSRSDDAMRLQVMCASRMAPEIDDGVSDAQSVALALSLRCSREYRQATEAFGAAFLNTDAQRRMFSERRNSTQEKIEAFLPSVMRHRASMRKNK